LVFRLRFSAVAAISPAQAQVSLTRRLTRRALTLPLARKSGRNGLSSLFGGRALHSAHIMRNYTNYGFPSNLVGFAARLSVMNWCQGERQLGDN
jgi:hypothetical protein